MQGMDKSADLMLRITPEMLAALKSEAAAQDASVAFVVRGMLKAALTARGYFATQATTEERATVRAHARERKRATSG
jgi:hypothetical protein